MPHTHSAGKKFTIGMVLNTGFSVFELVAGLMTGSLALISDAGHNFTDSVSLVIAYAAERFGRRRADIRHTYGHERATILAALVNTGILCALAVGIFYNAILKILNPAPVQGGVVMLVALGGIVINGVVAFLYSGETDLHMRSAYLNMAYDTVASVVALIAGGIIYVTHQTIVDPIVGIGIGIMLLFSAWNIMEESIHILLEGVPKGIATNAVAAAIKETPHVSDIDDLHIWSLSSKDSALSCHIITRQHDMATCLKTVRDIKHMLHEKFGIGHATIEIESENCYIEI